MDLINYVEFWLNMIFFERAPEPAVATRASGSAEHGPKMVSPEWRLGTELIWGTIDLRMTPRP